MSNEKRKYVGARYVPLFSDPLEWSNTRTYEPLTINQMAIPDFCRKSNGNTNVSCVPGGKSCFNFNGNLMRCVIEDIAAGSSVAMNYTWKAGF